MAVANLKNMAVDELLTLRSDVERALAERTRDLERRERVGFVARGSLGRVGLDAGATAARSMLRLAAGLR